LANNLDSAYLETFLYNPGETIAINLTKVPRYNNILPLWCWQLWPLSIFLSANRAHHNAGGKIIFELVTHAQYSKKACTRAVLVYIPERTLPRRFKPLKKYIKN